MGKHQTAVESGEITEIFSEIVSGYKALNAFLWYLNEDSSSKDPTMMDGVLCLFENQFERLEDVKQAVEIKDSLLDDYRSEIAAFEGLKEEPPTATAVKLRQEFIATKAKEGADLGDIAAAMNMKKTSIERVIRQLKGADATPETAQAKAVNG